MLVVVNVSKIHFRDSWASNGRQTIIDTYVHEHNQINAIPV